MYRRLRKSNNPVLMMQTGEARNTVKTGGIKNLSVPPGFTSRTAFILKRTASGEDTQKTAFILKNASDLIALSSHKECSPEDNLLEANLQIKHRAWIVFDQLDHREKEPDDKPSHENASIASEGCLPKGLIWGCSACSNCVKVPAKWDPEGAHSIKLEEAPVFQPTDEEFNDTLKYIESIYQQVKPYGLCRIVPPTSWQPPSFSGENSASEGFDFSTEVQRITDFGNCTKRKRLAFGNAQESKRRKIFLENNSANGDTVNGSLQAEQFQFGPHFSLQSFKNNAEIFKESYFQITSDKQWEPSEEDIEGEYWRILENPTAEIEVLCRANLDADSVRKRVVESLEAETSNSIGYQDSGWNLSNLYRLPGSLLSFENSDYLRDLAPKFRIGMCFSTLPWELAEQHLDSLCCLYLGAPKLWYGVPGHHFHRFQAAVKKHLPGSFAENPELLYKLAMQVSPSALQAEGIPVYRCIQRPKEFILFVAGAYHTGFDCGFNVSESACFPTLDWLPHIQSVIGIYPEKQMKQLICPDKILFGVALKFVVSRRDYLLWGVKDPEVIRWKDTCGKGSAIAVTLKARVREEARQREFLCTESQSRKMDKCFDEGEKKECCICNFILYLSAAYCKCNTSKYACLKHTKKLCSCAWSEKVFLFRFDNIQLNLLAEATDGKFSAIHKWAKDNMPVNNKQTNQIVLVDDDSSADKALEHKGETCLSSADCNVDDEPPKQVIFAETMARILGFPFTGSQFDALSEAYSDSESDDERSFVPVGLLDEKKPLTEAHSASNGQETKSSGKQEVICLSSDNED